MRQQGLFGLSDHLKRLSAYGDPLEVLAQVVDFEAFRPTLVAALAYSDGTNGGRPPYDPVTMLKVLVLAAQNNVSDARMEYLIRDRLSWSPVKTAEVGRDARFFVKTKYSKSQGFGRLGRKACDFVRRCVRGLPLEIGL